MLPDWDLVSGGALGACLVSLVILGCALSVLSVLALILLPGILVALSALISF